MGREVRRVPADWQHPNRPLYDGKDYAPAAADWDALAAQWAQGWRAECFRSEMTLEDYDGPRPDPADYMPQWSAEEATHYMMYETCTEGTPISPPFSTPEALARWLADTGASAFAGQPASYEDWLATIRAGQVTTGVFYPDENAFISGVAHAGASAKE